MQLLASDRQPQQHALVARGLQGSGQSHVALARGRQLVNESGWLVSDAALANRARQLVNGDISIDLDIDLLTNYVDPLTGEILNPDGTIPNRGYLSIAAL